MVFKRKNQPFKDLVAQAAFIGYIKMVFHIRTLIYLKHRSIVYYIVCVTCNMLVTRNTFLKNIHF